jgi:benzylsuccinate CoA-transferase BbsF subunit
LSSQPLSGVRVIEFGQLIAIPHATKLMSDMGAEVIRVESLSRMDSYRLQSLYGNTAEGDFWNRAANFYEQNRNKQSVTLDITDPLCLEALRELVAISDVFAENFTPRVMRNFGLEYDDLRKIRPDIIMVSSTGYGYTGPWGDLGAIGYTTESASGMAHITGYRDGPPMIPEIPYADYTAAEHTLFAIMAALIYRNRTGKGQFIDVSQTETLSATIPEALMDFTVNGRTMERQGNRDMLDAPQGCYPCQGKDNWIALTVQNTAQWRSLCEVLGLADLCEGGGFDDAGSRAKAHDLIDERISGASRRWDKHDLMEALQTRGVPAGAVQNARELLTDPHLRSRRFYEMAHHHESTGMPPLPYTSRPWKMSETPGGTRWGAPVIGQHNREVLVDMLGMAQSGYDALVESGKVGTNPTGVRRPSIIPMEDQVRLGRIVEHDTSYRDVIRDRFDE